MSQLRESDLPDNPHGELLPAAGPRVYSTFNRPLKQEAREALKAMLLRDLKKKDS